MTSYPSLSESIRARLATIRVRFAVAVVAALVVAGCSGAEDDLPRAGGGLGGAGSFEPCEDGAERTCGETVEQANGVLTCYEGRQYCEDGSWGECTAGTLTYRPDPTHPDYSEFFRRHMQALSPPNSTVAPCGSKNLCDPRCMYYGEDPTDITADGGSVSTDLPEYPGGTGVQACDHDLCTAGATLYSTCHWCVERVCAATPSCCSTAWTDSCVDQVYNLCTNIRPPLNLCDFGMYSDSSVTVANRATADALIGAYGNVNFATEAQFGGVRATGNVTFGNLNQPLIAPLGIIADGYVDAQDANYAATTYIEAGGYVAVRSWDITGSVSTGGNLTGQNSTTIGGNAKANGTISTISSIAGTQCQGAGCYTHKPVSLPPKTGATAIPTLPTICTGTVNYNVSGGTTTIAPGTFGDVNIFNNGRLVLNGEGVYYFKSFQVWDRIEFRRNTTNTGQGWDIRVCGTTSLGNGTQFVGSTVGGATPALVLDSTNSVVMDSGLISFFTATTSTVNMGTNVYMTGVFMAPNAAVVKADVGGGPTRAQVLAGTRAAPINGAIWAKQLTVGTDAVTKQISASACEAMIPEVVTPSTCPITNVTPDIPPAINEPCRSGLDCQMNYHCIEPQTGTTAAPCAHSKCMPGTALTASCDPCVQRICDTDPTCCSTSWSTSCVAKVATLCDATCGSYACYHPDICSAMTTPPSTSCSTCIANVCAVMPSCCSTAWTAACGNQAYTTCGSGVPNNPTTNVSICDYAAYSYGATAIQGTAATVANRANVLGGNVGGRGLGSLALQYGNIGGTVYNAGSFAAVGSVVSGNIIWGSGTNSISSTTYAALVNGNPTQPERLRRATTCSGTTGVNWGGASLVPGNYGAIDIPNGGSLTLSSAGTYTFTSFGIGRSGGTSASYGTLILPATGDVTIIVCGAVNFFNFARMTGVTSTTAMNVEVYATNNIRVYPSATVYGAFSSDTDVRVETGATLYGYAWSGGTVNVNGAGATVNSTGYGTACRTKYDLSGSTRRIDRLCGYSAYSKTTATLNGSIVGGGDLGAAGAVTVNDTSRVYTNVLAIGNVTKGTNSAYAQAIRSRGTISGTATASGGQVAGASTTQVPSVTFPTVSFSCTSGKPPGGTDVTYYSNTSISPGTFGNLIFGSDNVALTLAAGDYYIGELQMNRPGLGLILPASGNVRIFACGKVLFANTMTMTNAGSGSTIGKFRVYSLNTNSSDTDPAIYVNNGAPRSISGILVAPNGKISIGSNSTLNGAAWGNAIYMASSNSTVNATGFAGSSCEALGVDVAATCPFTVTATPPNESAQCEDNALGYTDPTCTTYDLAADVPCGTTLPICNHGTGAFNGNVTIGYWAEGDGQMSLRTPSKVPDGTCTATGLSIAAGNCVEVTCAMPNTNLHTIMLDPSNTLSECGTGNYNRRLDNWTVHDGRTCSGPATPVTVEYEYTATCPEDSSPRWGSLIWTTDAPGTSTIEFSAKTASTSAGLSSESYVLVGTAASAPVDTSTCSVSGPGPACPVDLTAALDLPQSQDGFLALKIELLPTTDSPVLQDWEIRYTCVYDQ